MNGYQPKKTCDRCLSFDICKMAKKAREGKDACKLYKEIPPPPPPKNGSNAIPKKTNGTKKVVVIKVDLLLSDSNVENVRKQFIEQAKTGIVVADKRTEIYTIEVTDDISDTEIKVEFIR